MKTSKTLMIVLAGLILASCSSKDDESVTRNISSYGVCLGSDNIYVTSGGEPVMTAAEFQKNIVGCPLRCVESHLIHADGTIEEKDYYSDIEGIGYIHFLIDKDALNYIMWSDAYGLIKVSHAYEYDEETSHVSCYYPAALTLLSYDEETGQLSMIVHHGTTIHLLSVFQRMPMDWWKELESKCSVLK